MNKLSTTQTGKKPIFTMMKNRAGMFDLSHDCWGKQGRQQFIHFQFLISKGNFKI